MQEKKTKFKGYNTQQAWFELVVRLKVPPFPPEIPPGYVKHVQQKNTLRKQTGGKLPGYFPLTERFCNT